MVASVNPCIGWQNIRLAGTICAPLIAAWYTMKSPTPPLKLAILLIVAGCSPGKEHKEDTAQSVNTASPEKAPLADANEALTKADKQIKPAAVETIPAAIRGRWGLHARDCTSVHGDAKGLMEISASAISFYESRGDLIRIGDRQPTHIRADFAFSGEGMTWQQDMSLDMQRDGRTLIRRDFGEGSSSKNLRYTRCS